MRFIKQEVYFPIIVGVHFLFWAIDLSLYQGSFMEVSSDTLFFGELTQESWFNIHRILGEVFSSWVVTVFAFNFLMATRAKWVERIFGGLDKMYMIHRRSGVIAVFLLLAHFLIVPRDLVEFTPGKPLGFYALILILIGVILSAAPIFKRKIPYHKWLNIHKLMGAFYTMGVVHGLMVNSLIKELPITRVYVFGMAFIGIIAWIYRAFLFKYFNKEYEYRVEKVGDVGAGITEIEMIPLREGMEFLAGQFAFFKFPDFNKREKHPFTISSHPSQEGIRVSIKGLGDFTNKIKGAIRVGDIVKVEGPYGHFSSSYIKEKDQVWLAGGIGITPFLSLAKDKYPNRVHLFWCMKGEQTVPYKEEFEEKMEHDPRFSFTLWNTGKSGRITAKDLGIDELGKKAFLICGPEAMKGNLRSQLISIGVRKNLIYDEEFAFR